MQTKRLIAEFLGTMILVTAVAGSFIVHSATKGQLGLVGIGLISGITLLILTQLFGNTSGAHFNPAVTLAFAMTQRFPLAQVIPYIIAQLLGGIAGIGLLKYGLANVNGIQTMGSVQLGVSAVQGVGIEIFGAFIFMMVIMMVATDKRGQSNSLTIGLAFVFLTMLLSPLSGAALNPARAFGPAVWLSIDAATKATAWNLQWLYWVAPIVGATMGAVIFDLLRTGDAVKGTTFGVLGPIAESKRLTRSTNGV